MLTRRSALAAGAGVGLVGAGPAGPRRIVSLNPCLDAILVHVADRGQIAALSHYSHDLASSSLGKRGLSFPFTYESAEEVMALHPDLVLCGRPAPTSTRAALMALGVRLETFGAPSTIAESLAQVREVASAVGRRQRGEQLVAQIQSAIAASAPLSGVRRPTALIFQSGGFAVAPGTLMDEMLTRAGFDNAATRYGLVRTGYVALENILADPPEVLLASEPEPGAPTWADRVLTHPALAKVSHRMARISFPQQLTFCGGPVLIETAAMLARARRTVLATPA